MIKFRQLPVFAAALSACSQAQGPSAPQAPDPVEVRELEKPKAPQDFILSGAWQIVEIDSAPPLTFDRPRDPNASALFLRFGHASVGGNAGCNGFGGIGVQNGDRYVTGSLMSTQMSCGKAVNQQEGRVRGLLSAGVTIKRDGEDVVLTGNAGELRLTPLPPEQSREVGPEIPARAPLIAGLNWHIKSIGRTYTGRDFEYFLQFEAETWTAETGCGALSGLWYQDGYALKFDVAERGRADCPAKARTLTDAFLTVLESDPVFRTDPNAQFVLAGRQSMVIAQKRYAGMDDHSGMVKGHWRVESLDGETMEGASPLTLRFGDGAFTGGTVCGLIRGVFVVGDRSLAALPTLTPNPEADCSRAELDIISRLTARIAAQPQAAKTDTGLALVGYDGVVRLVPETDIQDPLPRANQRLESGLKVMLDVDPDDPPATLSLSNQKFTVTLPCGKVGGRWFPRRTDEFYGQWSEASETACQSAGQGGAYDAYESFFIAELFSAWNDEGEIVLLNRWGKVLTGQVQ